MRNFINMDYVNFNTTDLKERVKNEDGHESYLFDCDNYAENIDLV